jgi:hypothetical protein
MQEDFPTIEKYLDYQEEVEDMIYNIVHKVDLTETEKKVEEYKKRYGAQISLKQAKYEEHIADERQRLQMEEERRRELEIKRQAEKDDERRKKVEQKIRENKIQLGEAVEVKSESNSTMQESSAAVAPMATPAPLQMSIHPLAVFQAQRPLPMTIKSEVAGDRVTLKSVEKSERVSSAGGFDLVDREKRNWEEIRAQIKKQLRSR